MDFKKDPKTDFADIDELSPKEAKEEAEALREGIEYHNRRYYLDNDPAIADAVFDRLFSRLQELEEAFTELRTDASPTRRVGVPPADERVRVEHAAPMLSLNAALEKDKIRDYFDFLRRETGKKEFDWVLEPKFDGVSVEVVYEKGRFRSGTTRGDGESGERISDNLATINTLPLRLQGDPPDLLAVRGEVFLAKEAFQELNRQRLENGKEAFANPRNACAGTIRRLESTIVARWPLDIFFYDILKIEGEPFSRHWEELEAFARWGLKTNPLNRKAADLEGVDGYRKELLSKREELEYEIDGIVIKLDDLALQGKLGTRHRSPRWAMAWKFEPRKEMTTLEKIVVQVGTSGILTPVALLRPVDVGGVTVSRATLHNEREVEEKDLREGDRVRVKRAGDVIPELVERVERPNKYAHTFHMPKTCPACGTEVAREGAYVRCPAGLSCPAQLRGRIRHYGSRQALNIEHLGEKTVRRLVERDLVTSLSDLYRLEPDQLQGLDGFAAKSARQLYDAIQNARQPRLDRFLYALSIRHVGSRLARTLAERFGTLDRLMDADREELESIPDIGPEIAGSLTHFFTENREAIKDLEKAGVRVQPLAMEKSRRPLEGKTFVFTGALGRYTRSEAQKAVEDLGASAVSSVSGNTDYLVVGDEPGQKLAQAKEQGVKILGEEDFLALLSDQESQ